MPSAAAVLTDPQEHATGSPLRTSPGRSRVARRWGRGLQRFVLLGTSRCKQFPSSNESSKQEDGESGVTLVHHGGDGGVDQVQSSSLWCSAHRSDGGGESIGACQKAENGNNDAKELVHGGNWISIQIDKEVVDEERAATTRRDEFLARSQAFPRATSTR